MNLKKEEVEKIRNLKDLGKNNINNVEEYLQSIAESLAVIAHKIGRKLL